MASPRRAVLRRSGDETAAASAMLNTFFRDARMFSGTIWVQRVAYKIVSNDTTSKRARFILNVIKRLGSPRGAYRAASMRTSQNSVRKLSEKSRRCVKRGLPGHRSATIWPVSAPIYRPNPSSERCSDPFSDSFKPNFGEFTFPRSRVNSYPWIGPGCLTPSRAITSCAYRFYGSTVYRRHPSGILVAPTVVRSFEGDTVHKRKTRERQPGALGPRPWLHCRTAGTRWSPERGPKA